MLDQLSATVDGIVAAEAAENTAVAQAFSDLLAEIATLKAGTLTQAQIDAITAKAAPVVAALQSTQAAAAAADPGAPPAP